VYNYINPVFDGMFIEDSYSCRKNKGTLYGIRRVQGFIRECSRDYTVDCYILKLDIKGYFMSINKDILYGLLSSSIEEAAKDEDRKSLLGADTGLIMYLIQNTLYDDPVENCVVRGQRSDWQGLPPSKSLFHSRCGCGLPIGNLTSQLFSNVYLHPLDTYVKSVLQMPYYGRYVDDFVLVHNDRNVLKQAAGKIEAFLDGELQLELHPLKRYLQHYTKGVNFLGAVIKPHRSYIANRTKKNFAAGVRFWNNRLSSGEPTSAELAEMRACINSYLGIMMHHYSYNIRKKALLDKENLFLKYGYLNAGLRRFVLKKKYRPPDRGIFASRRVNRFKPETIEICCTEKTLSIL